MKKPIELDPQEAIVVAQTLKLGLKQAKDDVECYANQGLGSSATEKDYKDIQDGAKQGMKNIKFLEHLIVDIEHLHDEV